MHNPNEDSLAVLAALYAVIYGLAEQGSIDETRLKESLRKILDEMPAERREGPYGYYLEKLSKFVGGREPPNLFVVH